MVLLVKEPDACVRQKRMAKKKQFRAKAQEKLKMQNVKC